ncbi:hypothetical protein B0H14DRAFT_3430436 [Mycena olivaceomarginata]|nr:hypothetical protein B0H14DRAFT_3430436 [Mycena olivaceomarginata]
MLSISEADTDSSISSDLSTTDSGPGHGDSWSDLLGSDWHRYLSSSSASSTDTTLDSSSDDGMPELYPAGYPDSDDESDSDSSYSTTGAEGDDEEDFEDDLDTELEVFSLRVGQNNPTKWNTHPDLFRQELRMSPYTFNQLVIKLAGDPVFANDSQNAQMPVETQLAIALFCFGHSGSTVSLLKVANWAGMGKGTITLVT